MKDKVHSKTEITIEKENSLLHRGKQMKNVQGNLLAFV